MFGSGLLCSSGSSRRTPLSARPRARRHVHDGRRLLPDGLSGAWRAVGGACCSERRGSRVAASGTAERGATGRCWGAVRVLRAARSSCVPIAPFQPDVGRDRLVGPGRAPVNGCDNSATAACSPALATVPPPHRRSAGRGERRRRESRCEPLPAIPSSLPSAESDAPTRPLARPTAETGILPLAILRLGSYNTTISTSQI
jgi:hypothetical protein